VLATSAAFAQEIKNLSVKQAIEVSQKEIENANNVYRNAVKLSKTKLLIAVEQGLKSATQAGNLDEANKLNEMKIKLQREIDIMGIGGKVFKIKIEANKEWQKALEIKAGMILEIKASAKWHNDAKLGKFWDADGPVKGDTGGALIGRINGKDAFFIGKDLRYIVKEDSILEMRQADTGPIYDNVGFANVEITIVPVAPEK
jgi:hypothetical protein